MSFSYALRWIAEEKTLKLIGILDRNSLIKFWDNRYTMLDGKQRLDLSKLAHVDSAGLAMLVYVQNTISPNIIITGVSKHLFALIKLYNLNEILLIDNT